MADVASRLQPATTSGRGQAWGVAPRPRIRTRKWEARRRVPITCLGSTGPSSHDGHGQGMDRPLQRTAQAAVTAVASIVPAVFIAANVALDADGGGSGGPGSPPEPSGGRGDGHGGGAPNARGPEAAPRDRNEDFAASPELLLDVLGMHCGGCVGRVQAALEALPGVAAAEVNLATETARLRLEQSEQARTDAVAAAVSAVERLGFECRPRALSTTSPSALSAMRQAFQDKQEARQRRLRQVENDLRVSWALASTCLVGHLSCLWRGAPAPVRMLGHPAVAAAMSVAAMLGPGRSILASGLSNLARGQPDMDSLVSLGASATMAVSTVAALRPRLGWHMYFEEPAMLLAFVQVGRTLEERAKLRVASDMTALRNLLPTTARRVLPSGSVAQVAAEDVQVGEVVRVLPGDRVPVDGVVVSGVTSVDESAMTGEAMPVAKRPGSAVRAGTANCEGAVDVRVERAGADTAIADVVRQVDLAQARAAPIQRIADAAAGSFTYGVLAASAATFSFWRLVGARTFPRALELGPRGGLIQCIQCIRLAITRGPTPMPGAAPLSPLALALQLACNVLVVACPCALGLATPTAVLVGMSAGAREGLLVRGGDVLERAAHIDAVIFDKTGTLTVGRPTVSRVSVIDESAGLSDRDVLALAATVESLSVHPVAKAIAAEATRQGVAGDAELEGVEPGTYTQVPGAGVVGTVGGRRVAVGRYEFVVAQTASVSGAGEHESARSLGTGSLMPRGGAATPSTSRTVVFVGVDGQVVGRVEVEDKMRSNAAATVAALRARGYRPVLLSGDQAGPALAVGRAVGIPDEDVHAGVSPWDKAAFVETEQRAGRRVAMVGDGINDTVALAKADVGMAMVGGVDAASDVSDVVLTRGNIRQVVDALDLSRATLNRIKQNLAWAFGYNAVGIPVAAGALLPRFGVALTPALCAALMGLSSIGVVLNSVGLRVEAARLATTSRREEEHFLRGAD